MKVRSPKNEPKNAASKKTDDSDDEGVQQGDAAEDDIQFGSVEDIFRNMNEVQEDHTVILPDHLRCMSHTLNLVATTDVNKAIASNESKDQRICKTKYRSAMGKAEALWNICSRSTKAGDAAYDILGFRFSVPCDTRWASLYNAVGKVLKADGKQKLPEVCAAVGVPVLTQVDTSVLREYHKLMKPIAEAIKFLEGEKASYLGQVLPTLYQVRQQISELSSVHLKPLKEAILKSVENRFGHLYYDDDYLLSTVTNPKFKADWVSASDVVLKARITQKLTEAVNTLENDGSSSAEQQRNISHATQQESDSESEEHEHFTFLRQTTVMWPNHDIDEYWRDTHRELIALDKYPKVKALFTKYNTALPSSAPVERLFSRGSLVLTKRRNCLGDTRFEQLLLLKVNTE